VVGEVDEVDRAALRDYVEAGGTLWVWGVAQPFDDVRLLPWSWGNRVEARPPEGSNPDRVATAGWVVGPHWEIADFAHDAWPRWWEGEAIVMEVRRGRGRVVAATFSPASGDGSLAGRGTFFGWMHGLLDELTRPQAPASVADPLDPRESDLRTADGEAWARWLGDTDDNEDAERAVDAEPSRRQARPWWGTLWLAAGLVLLVEMTLSKGGRR
jgi:hypothetical protein